jgi:hypothetical protein
MGLSVSRGSGVLDGGLIDVVAGLKVNVANHETG